MKKAISPLIGMVLLVIVIVASTSLVLNVGFPMMERMKDTSSIKENINFLRDLDSKIRRVSTEGTLSSRSIDLIFNRGQYYCDNDTNSLIYSLDTESHFISSQTSKNVGNVILSSDASVSTNSTLINDTPCYMMENTHLKACIKKLGSEDNLTEVDTSQLLVYYYNKDLERELNVNLSVYPNDNNSLIQASGFTELRKEGEYIGKGRVTAHVMKGNINYKIIFELRSGSDFLIIEPREAI